MSGEKDFKCEVEGSFLIYDAYPDDESYNDGGNWMAIKNLDKVAANVVSRIVSH